MGQNGNGAPDDNLKAMMGQGLDLGSPVQVIIHQFGQDCAKTGAGAAAVRRRYRRWTSRRAWWYSRVLGIDVIGCDGRRRLGSLDTLRPLAPY